MANGGMTDGAFKSFIKGLLRRGSARWKPRYEVLADAKRGKQINKATGRLAEHYECASCHGLFPLKYMEVDHISSIMYEGIDWDETITRMFCDKEGLQVLCKDCHRFKTNLERKLSDIRKLKEKDSNRKQKRKASSDECV